MIDVLSIATDGYLSKYKRTLSIATRGYMSQYAIVAIPISPPSLAPGTGMGLYVDTERRQARELREVLLRDDEDILLLLQIFMMRWN